MFRPFTSRELRPIVVAIPVRDEGERIGQCLAALSQQNEFQADHVVLLVNNTIDDSIAIARQRPMPAGTCLHIIKLFCLRTRQVQGTPVDLQCSRRPSSLDRTEYS
jgi:hypothetical protein